MTAATRLKAPAPKPSTGRLTAIGRHVTCHCCGEAFPTAKPQDPERKEGYGTCQGCRQTVALDLTHYGLGGKVFTMSEAVTRLTRYA